MVSPTTVKTWAKGAGLVGAGGVLLLSYLMFFGYIQVLSHTEDIDCAGTEVRPCVASVQLLALKSVSVSGKWGFTTDKSVLSYKMLINGIDKTNKSFSFSAGKKYNVTFIVLKKNPGDKIKWTFGTVDPYFNPPDVWVTTRKIVSSRTVTEQIPQYYTKNCERVEVTPVSSTLAGQKYVSCVINATGKICTTDVVVYYPCQEYNGTATKKTTVTITKIQPVLGFKTKSMDVPVKQNCLEKPDGIYCISMLDGGLGNTGDIREGMTYCKIIGEGTTECVGHESLFIDKQVLI